MSEEEKYKKQYDKALSDLVKAEHDNIKKDKIMEAMAEYIANLDIDEDICKHNIEKMCKDEEYDVPLDVCISCIIQHFENKVNQ